MSALDGFWIGVAGIWKTVEKMRGESYHGGETRRSGKGKYNNNSTLEQKGRYSSNKTRPPCQLAGRSKNKFRLFPCFSLSPISNCPSRTHESSRDFCLKECFLGHPKEQKGLKERKHNSHQFVEFAARMALQQVCHRITERSLGSKPNQCWGTKQ